MKQRLREQTFTFLFAPTTDEWLTVLRVGLGAELVVYCLSLRSDWLRLFSAFGSGIAGRQFAEAFISLESGLIPTFGHVIRLAGRLGVPESPILTSCWLLLLAAGCGLIAGVFCRVSAVAAWFLHLLAAKSGGSFSYGVDNFMTIGLFYLMWSPLPDRYSFDYRRRSEHTPASSHAERLRFFRRVLQLHLCLIYFFSGLSKCLGSGWWNGVNLWRALIRPPFDIVSPELLLSVKFLLTPLGVVTCLLEVAYPVMIWSRRTRLPWLLAVCAMHLGIAVAMGMYLFGFVMIVLNVAAFWPLQRLPLGAVVRSAPALQPASTGSLSPRP